VCPTPLLFHDLLGPLVWISDLISITFACSQSITHSPSYASIVELGFHFSEPSSFSDASIFDSAARFNFSIMNLPASMNDYQFRASLTAGESLLPAYAAELSEDGEIYDSDDANDDDDIFFFSQIQALSQPLKQVIDQSLFYSHSLSFILAIQHDE